MDPPYVPSGKLTSLLKMAIELVDLLMNTGDFPLFFVFFVCLPEGMTNIKPYGGFLK